MKKKSLFPLCDGDDDDVDVKDAWPFSPAARAEGGAFFAVVRGGESWKPSHAVPFLAF